MSLELPPLPPSAFSRPATEELRARRVDAATFVLSKGRATLVGPDGAARALVAGQSTLSRAPFHVELGALGELTLAIPGRASARLRGPAAIQGHDPSPGRMVWTVFDAELCEVETRAPFHLVLPGGWVGDADASAFSLMARPDGGVDVELRAGEPLRIGRTGAGDATIPVALVAPGQRLTFSGAAPRCVPTSAYEPARPGWEVATWPFDAQFDPAATAWTSDGSAANRSASALPESVPIAGDEVVHGAESRGRALAAPSAPEPSEVVSTVDRSSVHAAVDVADHALRSPLHPDAVLDSSVLAAPEHVERAAVRAQPALDDRRQAAPPKDLERNVGVALEHTGRAPGTDFSLPIELARLRRDGNFVLSDSRWLQVETTAGGQTLFRLAECAPHRVACFGSEVDIVLQPGAVVVHAPGHALEVIAGRTSVQVLSAAAQRARGRGIFGAGEPAPAKDAGFREHQLTGVEVQRCADGVTAVHVPASATHRLCGTTPMQDFVLEPGASAFFDPSGCLVAALGSTTAVSRAQARPPEWWWLAWGAECAAGLETERQDQPRDPAPDSVAPTSEEPASQSCFDRSELLPAAAFEITELGNGRWVAWFDRNEAVSGWLVLPNGRYEFEPGTLALFDELCGLKAFIGTLRFHASSAGSR